MRPAAKQALLIVCAALVLALGVAALVRAHGVNEHLLAAVAVVGGFAILIVSLPGANGK